jgi:hypothetical protein
MCDLCRMLDGSSGGSTEPQEPQSEGEFVAIPVTENEDGTVTLTLTPEAFAGLQVQLALGGAVMGGAAPFA